MSKNFVIRDGLESDVDACMKLECAYETDYVWQMTIHEDGGQYEVNFKTERLPRAMQVQYPLSRRRLQLALPPDQCFLVAAVGETGTLGFLTMRQEPAHQIAWVQDIVVSEEFRRRGIGSRLLRVARQWALEHDLDRLLIETQTKNYPGIMFCKSAGLNFSGYNDQYFKNQDIALFFSQTLR